MNDRMFGVVVFVTYVHLNDESKSRPPKRVTLASVGCEYSDKDEVVENFRTANKGIRDIYARFVYEESL